jgi:hypothetical protein
MKRIALICFLLLTAPLQLLADRGKVQGFVEKGGQRVSTSSALSTNTVQQSYPGVSVTVYVAGTLTPATIYSTASGTAKANPFSANSLGFYSFFTDVEEVDIAFGGGAAYTLSDVVPSGIASDVVTNVVSFGAVCNGTTDDTIPINAAIAAVAAAGGGIVEFPQGSCDTTSPITMAAKVFLRGQGRHTSTISVEHDGNGVVMASPIDFSTGVYTRVSDLGIVTTRTTNTGAGYVDTSGTYVDFYNVVVSGFQHQIVLDQSEIVTIRNCEIIPLQINGESGIWLVNGPDHTQIPVVSGHAGGPQVVTPSSMTEITRTYNAATAASTTPTFYAMNADHTNRERITIASITATTFTAVFASSKAANWILGPSPDYTNRILIDSNQFNTNNGATTPIHIRDDGGGGHVIANNNFNNSGYHGRFAAVDGLTIYGNETEGAATAAFNFVTTTTAGDYVGPTHGLTMYGNTIVDAVGWSVRLGGVMGGTIKGNRFGQMDAAGGAILFETDLVTGVEVGANAKLVTGASKTAGAFLGGVSGRVLANQITQRNQTYATSGAIALGVRTITPANMGYPGTTGAIIVGSVLLCFNTDGTNAERVTVTGVTGTTFDADFASSKAANFLIYGAN